MVGFPGKGHVAKAIKDENTYPYGVWVYSYKLYGWLHTLHLQDHELIRENWTWEIHQEKSQAEGQA